MMKIVVPIMPTSLDALKKLDVKLLDAADIIEWRADFMPVKDLTAETFELMLEKFSRQALLFTLRTKAEGGHFVGTEADYIRLLEVASSRLPEAYLDVEFAQTEAVKRLEAVKPRMVLSFHDFHDVPKDLFDRQLQMAHAHPAFVKIAVTPHSFLEVLDIMRASERLKATQPADFITIAMGNFGTISRLLGSSWTFACLPDEASAPGQLTLDEALTMRRILNVH